MATATIHMQCSPTQQNKYNDAPDSPANWHFPGPSSRFNQRERASTHSRASILPSAAPILHTERRAHRRAHSSYHLPTSSFTNETPERSTLHKAINGRSRITAPYSAGSSESGRSPLSRLSSFTSANMAARGPNTPVKPSLESRHSHTHDSPYSDYFTDDARSIDEIASQSLPALETQQLLVRLNKIQSKLMRNNNDSQALYLVGRRMSEIENDMDSLHSQSRLDDSALFMEDAKEEVADKCTQTCGTSFDGACDMEDDAGKEQADNHARLLKENLHVPVYLKTVHNTLQKQVHGLMEELRKRTDELTKLQAEYGLMQKDLELDHAEIMILDGQARSIESRLNSDPLSYDTSATIEAMRADCRVAMDRVKAKRIRWSHSRTKSGEQYDEEIKTGYWQMHVVRDSSGRVNHMTFERQTSLEDDHHPHIQISEVTARVVNCQSTLQYVDQAVQTEHQEDVVEVGVEEYDPRTAIRRSFIEDDLYSSECAITTSPPSERDTDSEHEITNHDEKCSSKNTSPQTPWHRLWDELAEFTGLGAERWNS